MLEEKVGWTNYLLDGAVRGAYGTREFIELYCPYSKEQGYLFNAWVNYRDQNPCPEGKTQEEWLIKLRNDFDVYGKLWLTGQFERGLSETGVGRLGIQPSYWFTEKWDKKDGLYVAPEGLDFFGNQAKSFINYDTIVGMGLKAVYERLMTSKKGEGWVQFSSHRLYREMKSNTDVLIFYRVVNGCVEEKHVEGKYIVLYQKLSPQEWEFLFEYFHNTAFDSGHEPEMMILNPAKVDLGNEEEAIVNYVEMLDGDFYQKYGRHLVGESDLEMYKIIRQVVASRIDELYDLLMSDGQDNVREYTMVVREMMFEVMGIWAARNRREISPEDHLREVINGIYPMMFIHPVSWGNDNAYLDPMAQAWLSPFEVSQKYCKKHNRVYHESICPECNKENRNKLIN